MGGSFQAYTRVFLNDPSGAFRSCRQVPSRSKPARSATRQLGRFSASDEGVELVEPQVLFTLHDANGVQRDGRHHRPLPPANGTVTTPGVDDSVRQIQLQHHRAAVAAQPMLGLDDRIEARGHRLLLQPVVQLPPDAPALSFFRITCCLARSRERGLGGLNFNDSWASGRPRTRQRGRVGWIGARQVLQ